VSCNMQYNFVNMSSVFNLYAVILYLYRLFGSIVDRMESCRTDLQWSKVWTIITLWRAIAWSPACLSVHHISWMLCNKYSRRPINNLASSLNLLSTLAECLSAILVPGIRSCGIMNMVACTLLKNHILTIPQIGCYCTHDVLNKSVRS